MSKQWKSNFWRKKNRETKDEMAQQQQQQPKNKS